MSNRVRLLVLAAAPLDAGIDFWRTGAATWSSLGNFDTKAERTRRIRIEYMDYTYTAALKSAVSES